MNFMRSRPVCLGVTLTRAHTSTLTVESGRLGRLLVRRNTNRLSKSLGYKPLPVSPLPDKKFRPSWSTSDGSTRERKRPWGVKSKRLVFLE